jgi:hypothetical protein
LHHQQVKDNLHDLDLEMIIGGRELLDEQAERLRRHLLQHVVSKGCEELWQRPHRVNHATQAQADKTLIP